MNGLQTFCKRLNPIKQRQMEERCGQIEQEISRLETEIGETETALATFVSAQESARLTELLAGRRRELQELMSEWEELSRALQD